MLSLGCITFLFLMGLLSYKLNNQSYAYFTNKVQGKETIEMTYTKPSIPNEPELSDNMIPVYYDEEDDTWKKADKNNSNEKYKWYDYDNKMWANAVTVTETNRSTYLSASAGTEIPMDDINTMWVWIPRYTYTYLNTKTPEEIKIKFEKGTNSSGTISCSDTATGTSSTSETCTDSTNGSVTAGTSTYTHPAFTFGDKELTGFWVGKFELTGSISDITVKPDLVSIKSQNISSFETNIMNMKNSGNKYGFTTSDDTHMIKNMEWGAVTYLSHSKYGTCTDGTCKEVNINNSSGYYTGRSLGGDPAGSKRDGTYKYNDIYLKRTTISGGTNITPSITNDTTYPWTEETGLYKSSTQSKNSTTTNLKFSFTAPTNNTYLSFDWSVSSESASYDYLYYTITKDGIALSDTGKSTKIGGTTLGTTESSLKYNNITKKLDAGTYELTFTYIKDNGVASGTDTGYIKNIKIVYSPTTVTVTKVEKIGEGKDGPSASTTHNIYGVYDMSGGAEEYVMGNIVNSSGEMYPSSSGFNTYPNKRYYDKYSYGTSKTEYTRGKLGDATKEMAPSTSSDRTWYLDSITFPYSSRPWFTRGGHSDSHMFAGLFNFSSGDGSSFLISSSRPILFH